MNERRYSPTDDLRALRAAHSATSGLSAAERAVLSVLILHRNGESGRIDPSVPRIAAESGYSIRTAIRALASLEAAGYMTREQRSGRRSLYTLVTPTNDPETPVTDGQECPTVARPVTQMHGASDTETPERTKERTMERTKFPTGIADAASPEGSARGISKPGTRGKKPHPHAAHALANASALAPYPPEFEKAWEDYPERAGGNGKKDAYMAWQARRTEGVSAADLHNGVVRYAAFVRHPHVAREGTQFVKAAATFFGTGEHYKESWKPPLTPGINGRKRTTDPQDYGVGTKEDEIRWVK